MTQESWTFSPLPAFLFCRSQMFLAWQGTHVPCLPWLVASPHSAVCSPWKFRALLLPSCLSSLASLRLLPLSPATAHLNLVLRPSAQTSQMIAKIWPSLSKILRITGGSLSWSSYMAFLRVHSLPLSMGAPCWAPLSKVVLPACCGRAYSPSPLPAAVLLLHSKPLLRTVCASNLEEERDISAFVPGQGLPLSPISCGDGYSEECFRVGWCSPSKERHP